MKRFPAMVLMTVLLVACGASATPTPEATATAVSVSTIQVAVASTDFQIGQPRLPIVLFEGNQKVADVQAVHLTAFDLALEPRTPGWDGDAMNYSDYEVPYWVFYPEVPNAGYWGFLAEITLADGTLTQAQFTIEVKDHSASPAIGDAPPASHNRTLVTEPDIHKLSSGVDPKPGLYQMTVADALSSGRPTLVTIATPGFCTSQLCAPVVHSVEQVYDTLSDEANFIHIEVYKTFDPLVYADEMTEWGLDSEPWTFLIDRNGKVAAKFGGPVSPRELTQALDVLLQ